ncbi:wd40 repeat-containing protein : WD40 repeat-containing protein OS=Leptolyngbya sp. PCC 7375 GN=Lepto7375DRAFT_5402 PE=4 SV=1: WD40: WD40 [Gemmata massiliana]|uniref:Uncharacterized protein n=1 Tax=Gemmata massiliana TaxID=1210884 RepID=A0A6P2D4U3_9BACT|nr:hypothetical protein [Gemmata massiliana]VTR94482.1 wd40 repeat-containing protein : WD40 repeat-containing protein OS=Leptolyngbya sp. PCC 7375 GN=Lepto7375DRAFT_5402 PE=4 SV=1: WD40: WD40 [Gemmata massiliana]
MLNCLTRTGYVVLAVAVLAAVYRASLRSERPRGPSGFDSSAEVVLGSLNVSVDEHVLGVAFAPDGRAVATGTRAGQVTVWTATGDRFLVWQAHPKPVCALCFLTDSQSLVSVDREGTLRMWSLSTGAAVLRAEAQGGGPAISAAAAPDGKTVAVGCVGRVTLWHADSSALTPVAELTAPAFPINAVTFSANGGTIAASSSGNGDAVVWRRGSAGDERVPVSPEFHARGLRFTADGATLEAVDTDGYVTRGRAGGPPQVLGRLSGQAIRQAAHAPGGRKLVIAYMDGTARLVTDPVGVAER